MKNHFLILALCCALAFVGCEKDEIEDISPVPEDMEEAFPDPIFREYVLTNFDTDGDGKISGKEALKVEDIDVSNSYYDRNDESKCIKSLEGIQYFTNLTVLDCRCNQLTALDVSKNTKLEVLWCSSNQLTSLDVSKNTQLEELYCYANQLTSLDVSRNTQLRVLSCYDNQLTALDVSKNTQLEALSCCANQLTSLDVSKNTKLGVLYCYSNQLTTLDVSKTNIGKGGNYTIWDGSTVEYPLACAPMETLKTLYLKKGWSIPYITEDNGRSTAWIPAQTQIEFVD